MRVLATAGHVDHGKSALVAALTGQHPDRLKEEQIREMTIDLGFAWFGLPGGEDVGIIDVPGHIDFIENMLAGMGGIDGVMLVIAADEGIMPQTREHLDIIDLLGINTGVVILNKVDLIDDPVWLDLIEDEISREISKTSLAGSRVLRLSSKTGAGIDELKEFLSDFSRIERPPLSGNSPRLAIDRVFSLTGFGTVVTGTLLEGTFQVGDEVEILPSGKRSRIRGIQTHNRKIDLAQPGSRTALNLGGVDKIEIKRGDVVSKPGQLKPTRRMDVSVRLLSHEGISLRHDDHVKLFVGTSMRNARIRLLEKNQLTAGEEGFLQIETEELISVKDGDRYIIRKSSPSITLGGGVVLESHPVARYKLKDERKLGDLKHKLAGDPVQLILGELTVAKTIAQLTKKLAVEKSELEHYLKSILEDNRIILIPKTSSNEKEDCFIRTDSWNEILRGVISLLEEKHSHYPYRRGFRIDEIERSVNYSEIPFRFIVDQLSADGQIKWSNHMIHLAQVVPIYSPLQEKNKLHVWRMFDAAPFSPPDPQQMREFLGQDLLNALLEGGDLVKVSEDVIFRDEEVKQMREFVEKQFEIGQTITVASFRDKYSTSRKFALAFLEYLDRQKVTRRQGDLRVPY